MCVVILLKTNYLYALLFNHVGQNTNDNFKLFATRNHHILLS